MKLEYKTIQLAKHDLLTKNRFFVVKQKLSELGPCDNYLSNGPTYGKSETVWVIF